MFAFSRSIFCHPLSASPCVPLGSLADIATTSPHIPPALNRGSPNTGRRRGFQIRSAGFRGLCLLSRIRQPPRWSQVAPKWFRGCNPEGTSATKELLIDLLECGPASVYSARRPSSRARLGLNVSKASQGTAPLQRPPSRLGHRRSVPRRWGQSVESRLPLVCALVCGGDRQPKGGFETVMSW